MHFSPTFVTPLSLQVRSLTPPLMQGTPGRVITQSMRISGRPHHRNVSGDLSRLHRVNGWQPVPGPDKPLEIERKSERYEKAMALVV